MSAFRVVLPEGLGYGIVVGIGFVAALLMVLLSYIQNRYTVNSTSDPEEFNTASRSVKPGLIATAVVSSWTWAATLLQSSAVAYRYGITGSYFYAAGATIQIVLFAVLAVKIKLNAPRCHTFLEVIHRRYGVTVHWLILAFALVTNLLVSTQLLLGGSAVVNALTGANVYACNILIPLGVVCYVVVGGLRATFLADYSHTAILMIIILYFLFSAFVTSSKLGSPGALYDLVKAAGLETPVGGNQNGSYLTMKSNQGLVFGLINVCANFATVFLDQGYWQRAIASKPSTAMRGYLLGGLAWFSVPFGFATCLGLVALGLRHDPDFPTFPDILSSAQIGAGLPAPAAAYVLLGKGGAVAMLIILFMAVTSALSSELIATSSIWTFDIYAIYIDPHASGKKLVRLSHVGIVAWAIITALGACIWNIVGLDLGWLYNFMGVVVCPAVVPVFYAFSWKKQPWIAMIVAPLAALVAGLTAWLVTAAALHDGVISIETTGTLYAQLAGNLTSLMVSAIVATTISLIWPADFDFSITRSINVQTSTVSSIKEKELSGTSTPEKQVLEDTIESGTGEILDDDENPVLLNRAVRTAAYTGISTSVILILIVPLPLFLSHYVFSKGFFTGWIVVSMLWAWVAAFITIVLPIWESWTSMSRVFNGIWADMRGKAIPNRAD
ncbi:solute symporter family transporter [Protomyces lactucae-debilis]|uniref:Solute symporter family transporter n=1 Tax=Protomyces lactucae-debilis TaxID=2754530 RepID=A0A1Y2F7W1_PROLT|nr:solute symporter family transporter [Protomyces lactucae-debilis]ORY79949.1 solute symporter family transporter [Protomyces lactucae-debilis]